MPVGMNEARVARTYSLLDKTDQMIGQLASKTFRSKANVIDLAVAKLHAEIIGTGSDEPVITPPDQPEPMNTK